MARDSIRAWRRKKKLAKVNKELEKLDAVGLQAKKVQSGKKVAPKSEIPVSGSRANKRWLIILVIVLLGFWIATGMFYTTKVSKLESDVSGVNIELDLKVLEIANLTAIITDLEGNIEEKEKEELDLSQQYLDVEESNEDLQEKIDLLESEKSDLENSLSEKEDLVSAYEQCIVDNDGLIDLSLSVCDSYIS
tara:strand:- start:1088 stop:1663 length:576 start_codon:yes stop_codon:yes gene_type:complete